MKLSRFTRIGMGVTGLLFVVWCILMFLASGGEKRTKAVATDDGRCPDCGLPLPKNAKLTGECPNCLLKNGPEAVAKAKARRQGGGVASSPVIPGVLIGAFCVLLATHLVIALRRRQGSAREEPTYFYTCPKCGRKLRYRQRQIGHAGKCPLCRRLFMFPRPLEEPGKSSLFQTTARVFRNLVSRKARQS